MKKFNSISINQSILIVLVLAVGFLVRYINLTGDAPAGDISRSGVFYVDEGTYAHNVVNKALFGRWFLQDDYNAISNVPVFSLFQFLMVKIFGVGLAQIRLGGIIYSLVSLLLLWVILRPYDSRAAIYALMLGSFNYFFIIYNRLALLENLLVLFLVVIAGLLFQYHQQQKSIWLILTTLFFVAGYFVKATIVFFLPVILVTIYLSNNTWKKRIQQIEIFFVTLLILIFIARYGWILPHRDDWLYFQQLNISLKIPHSPLQVLLNYARYFGNLKLFPFMPVIYTVFLFYVGILICRLYQRETISFPEKFFLTWTLSGILFLGFFAYSPPRFSLVLMPAIISLAAIFLSTARDQNFRQFHSKYLPVFIVVVFICAAQVAFGFYRIIRDHHHFLSCYLPLLSLLLIGLLYWVSKKKVLPKISSIIFASILIVQFIQIGNYHLAIRYSYFNAIKDMQAVMNQYPVKPDVLAGDIAPLVATELQVKAVNVIFRAETERNRFLSQRPTFLVLQDKKHLVRLQRKMPKYLWDVQLLKSYRIFDNYTHHDDTYFYRINAAQ